LLPRFCDECGVEVRLQANFCQECGSSLGQSKIKVETNSNNENENENENEDEDEDEEDPLTTARKNAAWVTEGGMEFELEGLLDDNARKNAVWVTEGGKVFELKGLLDDNDELISTTMLAREQFEASVVEGNIEGDEKVEEEEPLEEKEP